MRSKSTFLTWIAVAGLAAGIAFGGGVLFGRTHAAKAQTVQVLPTTQDQAGSGRASSPSGRTGRFGGAGVSGTIESVSGTTMTVKSADGTQTKVDLAHSPRVEQLQTSQVDQLKSGEDVVITGQAQTDGSFQATAVTVVPPGTNGTRGLGTPFGSGGGQ